MRNKFLKIGMGMIVGGAAVIYFSMVGGEILGSPLVLVGIVMEIIGIPVFIIGIKG